MTDLNLKPRLTWCEDCQRDVETAEPSPRCPSCGGKLYTVLRSALDGRRLTPQQEGAIAMTDAPTMLARIDELLATRQYEWARPTLEGIRETVARTGQVTLRQEEAVTHVMVGRLRHDAR